MTVAIIILSYNSLAATTRPCLESILQAKAERRYRVVIVDNGSTDGTREYLQSLAQQHHYLQIILNSCNLGYAAGNNLGIKAVAADYYLLLNSDTIVTDYWLDGLIGFLELHPDVGMAGPVSNAVGNEQLIAVNSAVEEEVIKEGIEWTRRCHGDFFFTEMLGFFCVAIRQSVTAQVGLLDESFGIGTFEDNDYCLRVRQAGFQLACVEDVFIYHKGSVSFQNSSLSKMNEIFYTNMKRYEQKHGVTWHPRLSAHLIIGLIDNYVQCSADDPAKALYKIANKLKILHKFDYSPQTASADELARKLADVYTSLSWRTGSAIIRTLEKLPGSTAVSRLLQGKAKQ